MDLSPINPAAFADLDDAPSAEVAPWVQRLAAQTAPELLRAFTGLLLDRTLRLLRTGSREDLIEEALALSRGISGETGRSLRQTSLETFGAWSALDRLLSEAGRRSDRAAVPSLLLGSRGHSQSILELLAAEGQPVFRSEIKRRLELAESQLSHLLRDLEEADLIFRYRRPESGREVLVELGRVGREVAERSVLPAWVERLADLLLEMVQGTFSEQEQIVQTLLEHGAPSRLAASRVAEALVQLAERRQSRPMEDFGGVYLSRHRPAARRFNESACEEHPGLQLVLSSQEERLREIEERQLMQKPRVQEHRAERRQQTQPPEAQAPYLLLWAA